jgi:probable HAF family extracellular repeat protein
MNPFEITPKWPRLAQLSLVLAMVGAPVCALAQSQSADSTRYTVVDLGPVGPSSSEGQPFTINAHGIVSGEEVLANPSNPAEWVSRAVLWDRARKIDIGVPGLGGPNSVAYGVNSWWHAVGQADTKSPDPYGEDFCGSTATGLTHSGHTCAPFLWEDGSMVELPRLTNSAGKEGSNGIALQINDSGVIAGTAENAVADSTCPGAAVSPQTIMFKPVIWTKYSPWSGIHVMELPTVGGDPDGIASAINGRGEAAGASGDCGPFNSLEQNNLIPLHAILWRNGRAIDLGNLGGDGKSFGIFASGLNDEGDVVGTSDTIGDASFHGFLWHDGHIADLGTVVGDAYSIAVAVGKHGLVLGVSLSANFAIRAALWRDGVATDMNTLVPADSPLYLESACSIDDKGEIIGFAYLKSNPNESHAYLAKPVENSSDER